MTAWYDWFLCFLSGELGNGVMVFLKPMCFSYLYIGNGLLTLEGNSITANGSDGIVDIILSLCSRVYVNHLKIHWHTAEPTTY